MEFREEEEEELQVLVIKNHKLCFDITQILNVSLDYFLTKHEIML